ncbi:LysR family transcriptional regulator [Pseudoduganella sp. FT26W]|uniref:LysR family transcriptional regulator n=1 Tax=Duganella aquatilis TaxID=2666082 RepID=A0A844CV54_9BURK|nr:LysR family transcriptional regulator [Duganella aquatilis]MRW82651.1 LysR family transcriptional regulator [Duganella aquatilis]
MSAQIGLESLTGLIAFARTASLGSYTAAARSLGVSPSAVSKSVQRLEEQLKLRLFMRTTRSLALTPEGRDLQERTLRLLHEIEQIEQAAASARAEPAGLIRVTAPLPVGTHILAPALPRFRERYPKVSIDLRMGDRYTDLIEEGIDVALRVGDPGDSRLISRQLAPHRLCAFAAPSYLAKRGTPRSIDDLMQHDCVNFRYQSSGQALRWPFQVGERLIEMTPSAGIIIDATDGVLAAVSAGGGIGISPTYAAATYVERGLLVPILPELAVERFVIAAMWPESRRGSPNVKAFVEFLLEIFPTPAPWDIIVAQAERKAHEA